MTTVLIVIHLMVVLAMIGLVLLQRSEGGALGIGGGSGAFMTGRSAGNVLTTSTAILAATFFVTSLGLALLSRMEGRPSDIFDTLPASQTAPAPAPAEIPSGPTPDSGAGESSSEDMLRQLNGSAGPQTPPAESGSGGETAPAVNEPALAAPAAGEPTPAAPAAGGGASPQVPPAGNSQ
jgi:preprotein translocase subunit SecG